MKEYDVITGSLETKRITLEIRRIEAEYRFDPRSFLKSMESHQFYDEVSRQMTQRLIALVASRKYDVKTVRFPSDWWQSFKKRFFPMWALQKYPIQYTEVTMEANAYYPEIEIPDKQAFVEVCIREAYRSGRI